MISIYYLIKFSCCSAETKYRCQNDTINLNFFTHFWQTETVAVCAVPLATRTNPKPSIFPCVYGSYPEGPWRCSWPRCVPNASSSCPASLLWSCGRHRRSWSQTLSSSPRCWCSPQVPTGPRRRCWLTGNTRAHGWRTACTSQHHRYQDFWMILATWYEVIYLSSSRCSLGLSTKIGLIRLQMVLLDIATRCQRGTAAERCDVTPVHVAGPQGLE